MYVMQNISILVHVHASDGIGKKIKIEQKMVDKLTGRFFHTTLIMTHRHYLKTYEKVFLKDMIENDMEDLRYG